MITIKCPNCGEEMVKGQGGSAVWARPLEHRWWGRPWTWVRLVKVCYHCGLMQLFVEDPSIFRSKTGTETLPRPASAPEPKTDTLPRAADPADKMQ